MGIEVAGLIFTCISSIKDALDLYNDLSTWQEQDLLVDDKWLSLAIDEGLIEGTKEEYRFSSERKIPTRELEGTREVVVALDEIKKIKYRIVQGPENDRLILTKKLDTD